MLSLSLPQVASLVLSLQFSILKIPIKDVSGFLTEGILSFIYSIADLVIPLLLQLIE